MLVEDFPLSNRTKNVLVSSGFSSESDFEGKFLEDIRSLKGLGEKGLLEIREYLYTKFRIVLKPKPKDKRVKDAKQAKSVINHLVGSYKKIIWAKEMLAANRLIDMYSYDVLMKVKPPKNVWSLTYYFTFEGKNLIRQFLPTISVEKVGVEEKEP